MGALENQLSGIVALSAPLEKLTEEIEQIQQAINSSEELSKTIEKDHPETYPLRVAALRDMQDHLNRKIAERDAYLAFIKPSIKEGIIKVKMDEISALRNEIQIWDDEIKAKFSELEQAPNKQLPLFKIKQQEYHSLNTGYSGAC
ncbi:hypothetical protein [Dyadobacter sp. 3J3]|uniref:hypothetical protein n=1 Tax=Dyadobacter sp. 3J3 TaxID=2606600 RepID=UPI00135AAFB7|nr:hypothetical protein [Dyadobacter sp. 3J3]